jgi:hypothetical protein
MLLGIEDSTMQCCALQTTNQTTRWLLHSRLNVLWAGVLHSFTQTFSFCAQRLDTISVLVCGSSCSESPRRRQSAGRLTNSTCGRPPFFRVCFDTPLNAYNMVDHVLFCWTCLQLTVSNLHDEAANNRCCLVGTFRNPLSRTPVRSHLSILINPGVQCWPMISSARSSVI